MYTAMHVMVAYGLPRSRKSTTATIRGLTKQLVYAPSRSNHTPGGVQIGDVYAAHERVSATVVGCRFRRFQGTARESFAIVAVPCTLALAPAQLRHTLQQRSYRSPSAGLLRRRQACWVPLYTELVRRRGAGRGFNVQVIPLQDAHVRKNCWSTCLQFYTSVILAGLQ